MLIFNFLVSYLFLNTHANANAKAKVSKRLTSCYIVNGAVRP